MNPWEQDYERVLKIRKDFAAKAEAIRKSGDFTPLGKTKRLQALDAELKTQLKKIDPSIK